MRSICETKSKQAGILEDSKWSNKYFVEIGGKSFRKFFYMMCPSPLKNEQRNPKAKELENVIESLSHPKYQRAKKAAINDLETLK